ncbi:membrane fusion protein, multidrug efflux system [Arachidicoccus rhizosphaerae]|uniref:Membrane fusion protein, multidrug efflux system n=1 Tax=Arachidicoccus rhizosphaerae TaxID=551991 RepID=A0A1H3X965_9BACT|nr:efflux RND transporter periplasmic adaptor subunit [Arachidicoccus rhizosphaerae]SDZ95955.1 membrane fusion protein, multidrug efflux system [Arachidicoccus rhizosphaerae]
MNTNSISKNNNWYLVLITALSVIAALVLARCTEPTQAAVGSQPAPSLPVIQVQKEPVTTYRDYTATVEGAKDIEIRPQVKGILSHIYADEGTYVQKGQVLFQIDPRPYRQAYEQATAQLASAKASSQVARINMERLKPLVQRGVVSDVELQTASATFQQAEAAVAGAKAAQQSAAINLDYTTIHAPVAGYISSIPYKTGSLVTDNDPQALTVLSETRQMHVYFSMSEKDFMAFKAAYPGGSIEEKLTKVPPVELILADGSAYEQKGKVELVEGAFDKQAGAISFRASFPNEHGLLRSGNTGKIRLSDQPISGILIPQGATFEIQDKIFAFKLIDSNKVKTVPIQIAVKKGNYYVLSDGLQPGDKIVLQGLDRLKNDMQIAPEAVSIDSLIKANPY